MKSQQSLEVAGVRETLGFEFQTNITNDIIRQIENIFSL